MAAMAHNIENPCVITFFLRGWVKADHTTKSWWWMDGIVTVFAYWNIQWDLRNFRDFEWLFIHHKPMVIMVILNPLTIFMAFYPSPATAGIPDKRSCRMKLSKPQPGCKKITFDDWSWWQTSPHQTRLIKDPGVNWHRYGKSTICTE